jgi:predicted DNA-binding transcriptional regulator AlpA
MVDNGLGPDELATWLGCSVDEALTQWLAAVQASRKPADEWDEIEPSDERNVDEALEMVRLATNMDEDQWREIEDMVRARIAGDGGTIAGVSSEPDEPWTMPTTGKFLTQHDIARVLGLPAVNVRVWNNRGKLPKPSGYVGKRPMWLRSEIRQWCEELNELRCGVGSS